MFRASCRQSDKNGTCPHMHSPSSTPASCVQQKSLNFTDTNANCTHSTAHTLLNSPGCSAATPVPASITNARTHAHKHSQKHSINHSLTHSLTTISRTRSHSPDCSAASPVPACPPLPPSPCHCRPLVSHCSLLLWLPEQH